jgi:hypothetical protein
MQPFDLLFPLFWAAIGVALDRLWTRWTYTPDEKEIWVDVVGKAMSISGPATAASMIKTVTSAGVPINDPHMVTVYVWAAGQKDITKEAFHNNRALAVNLRVPVMEVINESLSGAEGLPIKLSTNGTLTIGPGLMRKNFAYIGQVITEGEPQRSDWSASIADVALRSFFGEWAKPRKGVVIARLFASVLLIAGIAMAGTVMSGAYISWGLTEKESWFAAAAYSAFPAIILGIALLINSLFAPKRARKAVARLRANSGDKTAILWERSDFA